MNTNSIATISDELREQFLSCPGCFKNYSENCVPKVLPCGHTFCQECIPIYLKDSMKCPTCKTVVQGLKDQAFPTNFAINEMIGSKKTETTEEFNNKWKAVEETMKSLRRSVEANTYRIETYVREMAAFVKKCEVQVDQAKTRGIEEKEMIGMIEEHIRKAREAIDLEQEKLADFGRYMKTRIIPANVNRFCLEERERRGAHEAVPIMQTDVQPNTPVGRPTQDGERPLAGRKIAFALQELLDRRRHRLCRVPRPFQPIRPPSPIGWPLHQSTPIRPDCRVFSRIASTIGSRNSNSSSADNGESGEQIKDKGESSSKQGSPEVQPSIPDRRILRSAAKRQRTEND